MKYKTGFFSSFFKNKWNVETGANSLTYSKNGTTGEIHYIDIHEVRINIGILTTDVYITALQSNSIHIDGLSAGDSQKLLADVINHVKDTVTSFVLRDKQILNKLALEIHDFLKEDRYISNTDIRKWILGISGEGKYLSHPYFDPLRLPPDVQANIKMFIAINKPESEMLKKRNEEFVEFSPNENCSACAARHNCSKEIGKKRKLRVSNTVTAGIGDTVEKVLKELSVLISPLTSIKVPALTYESVDPVVEILSAVIELLIVLT